MTFLRSRAQSSHPPSTEKIGTRSPNGFQFLDRLPAAAGALSVWVLPLTTHLLLHLCQCSLSFRVVGINTERLAQVGDGLIVIAEMVVSDAALLISFRQLRIESHRRVAVGDGLFVLLP